MKTMINVVFAGLYLFVGIAVASQALPKISVQLWSVKNELKADFKGTLHGIKDMGFDGVELAGFFGPFSDNPAGLKLFIESLGLEISAAHIAAESLDPANYPQTIAFYKKLGVNTLIIPWDERAWHPQRITELVSFLNTMSKDLSSEGMVIGFHNHEKEFRPFNGSRFWDYLAANTVSGVVLQQDVGWMTYAGVSPVDYLKRYPGRVKTTHYKATLPPETKGKLPIIGQDTIDWLALLNANVDHGGTEWVVVEQEEYPNGMSPMESVKASKQGLDKVFNHFKHNK